MISISRRGGTNCAASVILLVAAFLRCWGLTWGLPTSTHYFSYHPDETDVLNASVTINIAHGQWLPHFYNYGSLQIMLVSAANALCGRSGPVIDLVTQHALWAEYYLTGRIVTVAMSLMTVCLVGLLARRLWGTVPALWAAAWIAVTPLHAQQSHWLTVDAPSAFWGVLCLFCLVRSLQGAEIALTCTGSAIPFEGKIYVLGWFVLACAACGCAIATKYNLALLWLPIACSLWWFRGTKVGFDSLMLSAVLVPVFAFILGCPGVVLDTGRWVSDVLFEVHHTSAMPGQEFANTGNGLVYLISHTLLASLGVWMLVLSVIAVIASMFRRDKADILLLIFLIPYCALISIAAVRFARYAMPILPVLALLCARLCSQKWSTKSFAVRQLVYFTSALTLSITLVYSILLIAPMARPDSRDIAWATLESERDSAGVLAFPKIPWFQTVPVTPYTALPHPGTWIPLATPQQVSRIAVSNPNWDLGPLQSPSVRTVVLSEYDTMDPTRLHDVNYESYMQVLKKSFGIESVFGGSNYQLWTLGETLPHDMLYPSPTITLYSRR